jgi:hypothetical protein
MSRRSLTKRELLVYLALGILVGVFTVLGIIFFGTHSIPR